MKTVKQAEKTHELPAAFQPQAEVEELTYSNDQSEGIIRMKKREGFAYFFRDQLITGSEDLNRIKRLVIPPAWERVWICKDPNGHIQATGYDTKGRKQYRYHLQWQESRNQSKFGKLLEFGKHIPVLRQQMKKDISRKELTEEKVIATVLYLMECTYIRIGNSQYERENHSYGLTTLKDRHVKISGSTVQFVFKGKKGVSHSISMRNKTLARIVKECRDIPGKELFQYMDADGNHKAIDSGKVNRYIKTITGSDFSAKDYRTWAGSINSLHAFQEIGEAGTTTEIKRKIVAALDYVSSKLGNTRTVCKKYYVHPLIIELYEKGALSRYLKSMKPVPGENWRAGLNCEERVLMRILRAAR